MRRAARRGKPEPNRWVTCLSCSQEFFIDSFELEPECQICGSKEYEDDGHEWDMGYYDDYNESEDY